MHRPVDATHEPPLLHTTPAQRVSQAAPEYPGSQTQVMSVGDGVLVTSEQTPWDPHGLDEHGFSASQCVPTYPTTHWQTGCPPANTQRPLIAPPQTNPLHMSVGGAVAHAAPLYPSRQMQVVPTQAECTGHAGAHPVLAVAAASTSQSVPIYPCRQAHTPFEQGSECNGWHVMEAHSDVPHAAPV